MLTQVTNQEKGTGYFLIDFETFLFFNQGIRRLLDTRKNTGSMHFSIDIYLYGIEVVLLIISCSVLVAFRNGCYSK